MSREAYASLPNIGTRGSPGTRRLTELPTVDRSPSRDYQGRGSPLGKHLFTISLTPTTITVNTQVCLTSRHIIKLLAKWLEQQQWQRKTTLLYRCGACYCPRSSGTSALDDVTNQIMFPLHKSVLLPSFTLLSVNFCYRLMNDCINCSSLLFFLVHYRGSSFTSIRWTWKYSFCKIVAVFSEKNKKKLLL